MQIAPLRPTAAALPTTGTAQPALPTAPVGAPGTPAPAIVEIDVMPGAMRFEQDVLELPAGTVTLRSRNPEGMRHNIAVRGDGVDVRGELVSGGGVSEVTVTLEAGTEYAFFCSLHERMGMKGIIRVV